MSDSSRSGFRVASGRSAVLIEARSSVGHIAFGTTNVDGYIEASIRDGVIDLDGPKPTGQLQLELSSFTSGNSLYDAELLKRIDARQHPRIRLELSATDRIGHSPRFRVDADLSFHGINRQISGTIGVHLDGNGVLHASGEHVFDIRDFQIIAPSVLMLRIYPDVRVELQLEATPCQHGLTPNPIPATLTS